MRDKGTGVPIRGCNLAQYIRYGHAVGMQTEVDQNKILKDAVEMMIDSADHQDLSMIGRDRFFDATAQFSVTSVAYHSRVISACILHLTYNRSVRKSWPWKRARSITARLPIMWLDLFNFDGFKREASLRLLTGAAPNSFLLAALIYRLNDWVPQVRQAAEEVLNPCANKTDAELVAETLYPLLSISREWGRITPSGRKAMIGLLDDPRVLSRVVTRLVRATTGPGSTILSQVAQNPGVDTHLLSIARSAVQPSVRAKAYRFLLQGQAEWAQGWEWKWTDMRYGERRKVPIIHARELRLETDTKILIAEAAQDPSSFVRRVAADALIVKRGELNNFGLKWARILSDDPHAAVRERARYVLDKAGASDDLDA